MALSRSYALISGALAVAIASAGCGAGQRSSSLLPPKQANAPALIAANNPPATPPEGAKPVKPVPTPQVQTPTAKVDPVAELISKVEKEYQAGQDNYSAGHPELARQNFDRAFNLLMQASSDLRADPRFQQEFQRVLDGVNGLELQAMQEGDGSAEQKSEPAPIDEANEVTFPADPNIKAKAAEEVKATHSDLPLMLTDPVVGYINYFSTRGRGTLEHALARSGRYREMVQRVFKQEGVPQDLIFLAQAESGFHPLAVSRAGARGMWQFMGSRAKAYGLQRNRWLDERQDPEKATRAAARHLHDLYNQFGDWYLAMAAYNSGPGTVQQAVKRTGYADFWELYKRDVLPKETRNYVPIIVAVTIMAKNPEQYGLDDVNMEDPVAYDTVKISYPVDLRLVAQCVDASAADLQDLNPSLLRLTTPKDGQFELHLPAGTKQKYLSAIAAIPEDMRVWWRYHTVKDGETLNSVARAYHTTAQTIAQANDLEGDEIEPDSKLVIPIAPGKHAADETATYAKRITRYKVRKGDTVQSVADNFGVAPKMIQRWNHLKGGSLSGRRVLYVHLPITPDANQAGRVELAQISRKAKQHSNLQLAKAAATKRHRVQPGETLNSIASTHHTTVAALKRDNGNLANLRPGMILVIRQLQ